MTSKILLFVTFISLIALVISGKQKRCPPLRFIEHGKFRFISRTKVQIKCDVGYMYPSLDGSTSIECNLGEWSNPKPMCIKIRSTCPILPQIENGKTLGDPPFKANSKVSYFCNDGFILDGVTERTCQPRFFEWTDVEPTCIKFDPSIHGIAERIGDKIDIIEGSSTGYIQSRHIPYDVEFDGLDLFLVFDKSSSIQVEDFAQGIMFVKFLIERFNISNGDVQKEGGTRLSVITFGDTAVEEISLTDVNIDSTQKAQAILDTINCKEECYGSTNLVAALGKVEFILENHARPKAKKALFIISDGNPDPVGPNERNAEGYAQSLRDSEMEIFAIGIGNGIDEYLLRAISSKPSFEHVFMLTDFNDFSEVVQIIREKAPPTPPPTIDECGYLTDIGEKVASDSVGTTQAGAWPWLAAIIIADSPGQTRFSCSGAVVCKNWVLTTALCLRNINNTFVGPNQVYVILGEDNFNEDNNNEQLFYAKNIIIHESFRHTERKTEHDLALIELNTDAVLGDYVRTACLPNEEMLSTRPGTVMMMVGWLTTSLDRVRVQLPFYSLQPSQIKVNILGIKECQWLKVSPSICLDKSTGTANIGDTFDENCVGDRGSLIMSNIKGRWNVIGITSTAKGCTLDQKFVMFSRTKDSWDWIRMNTDFCTDNHV